MLKKKKKNIHADKSDTATFHKKNDFYIHIYITMTDNTSDLIERFNSAVWLTVEEVQYVAGLLDAVLGCLLSGGETVVSVAVEILKTTTAIF